MVLTVYTINGEVFLVLILSLMIPVHIFTSYYFKIHLNIILKREFCIIIKTNGRCREA